MKKEIKSKIAKNKLFDFQSEASFNSIKTNIHQISYFLTFELQMLHQN